MAQFGGQKNPPWATQFAATAVSQPGHTGQSLDLNSLHCEYSKIRSNVISTLPGGAITLTFHIIPHSSWSAAAVSSGSISCCLLSAVSLGCCLSQQPVCCKLSAFSANCCFATASCSSRCSSITAGQSQKSNAKHSKTCVSFPWSHLTLFATAPLLFFLNVHSLKSIQRFSSINNNNSSSNNSNSSNNSSNLPNNPPSSSCTMYLIRYLASLYFYLCHTLFPYIGKYPFQFRILLTLCFKFRFHWLFYIASPYDVLQ